jgi:DNA repair protein RadC
MRRELLEQVESLPAAICGRWHPLTSRVLVPHVRHWSRFGVVSDRNQTRTGVRFGILIPRRTDDGKGDPVSDGHEDGARPPGYRLMLREMAADERPREKLKLRGSAALSEGELLAIILNTGSVGETVTDLSQRLLAHYGGLRGIFRLDVAELARIRGLGDAKAVRLKAALELGRRLAVLSPEERPLVGSPEDVANLLGTEMAALEQEELRVVLLDTKHRIVRTETVYRGSVNQAQVRVAEIFRDAVRQQATAIVAVHNHPSGDPTPSAADVALTVEIVAAGQLLDIELLDHLIIGQGRWLSLKRLGLGFPTA